MRRCERRTSWKVLIRHRKAIALTGWKTTANNVPAACGYGYWRVDVQQREAWEQEWKSVRNADERRHWANHIEEVRHRRRRNGKNKKIRDKSNPSKRVLDSMRSRFYMAIRGTKKLASVVELVGCSIDELRRKLEAQFKPGMTWDNYGQQTWHIDHIIPCAAFDFTDINQLRKCFHHSNLQPLWAIENHRKGAREGLVYGAKASRCSGR